jgi:hypothetical protein
VTEPWVPGVRHSGMSAASARGRRPVRALLLLGFAGLALALTGALAGCGSGGSPAAKPSGSASGSPSPSTSSSPSPSGSPPIGSPVPSQSPGASTALETHQGTVERGAEPSCLILHASDGTFELVGGSTSVLKPGASVQVRGYREKGLMSHCMQGVLFKVVSAQRAG